LPDYICSLEFKISFTLALAVKAYLFENLMLRINRHFLNVYRGCSIYFEQFDIGPLP
jgi:hypothetical protein